jgi:hypothetical protein
MRRKGPQDTRNGSRFKGKTEDLHRRAYDGRSCMEAGHSAVKVAWLVLVPVSILVKGKQGSSSSE